MLYLHQIFIAHFNLKIYADIISGEEKLTDEGVLKPVELFLSNICFLTRNSYLCCVLRTLELSLLLLYTTVV